jgi:hypothetical protein
LRVADQPSVSHEQVAATDLVERYLRHELTGQETEAFEAHFFACDVCFAELEDVRRLTAGVREAAARGWLNPAAGPGRQAWWTYLPIAASVMLVATTGWLWLVRVPALTAELDRARSVRVQAPAPVPVPAAITVPVPVAILTAERDATGPRPFVVPSGTTGIVLWLDAPDTPSPTGARLEILSEAGAAISTVDHLTRNDNGAYAVSVPAALMPPGTYRIRLRAASAPDSVLLGEFLLRVTTPR